MKKLCLALVVSGLLLGCFARRSEVVGKESLSYLRFIGNIGGNNAPATFTLSQNGQPVYLNIAIEPEKKYAITPGTYHLTIDRANAMVAERKLFLSPDQISEVNVP